MTANAIDDRLTEEQLKEIIVSLASHLACIVMLVPRYPEYEEVRKGAMELAESAIACVKP